MHRKYAVGVEVSAGGAHVRVWAQSRSRVVFVLQPKGGGAEQRVPLAAEENGYFAAWVEGAAGGDRYGFHLDDDEKLYPDPASRFQPDGPHGPSEIIDSSAFPWTDEHREGASARGQVIYEMHVGTFTPEGTWRAAIEQLPELAALGVTLLEVMPVADFSGEFGWGYDGVDLWAPTRLYGSPDDFRAFVDAAHGHGLGVILDVVYNHLGPDGNYAPCFSSSYFTDKYKNEWGDALNFDGEHSAPVREFFVQNARYWIEEFHLDGLRLDATQSIHDDSPRHVLADIAMAVREAGGGRPTFLVAENEPQHAKLARPEARGGYGLDALWNDDFHHAAVVAMTGRAEAYYSGTLGRPQEFLSALKWGYLYQGQFYRWQSARRGSSALDLPATAFVTYLENHDQVANSGTGARLHTLVSPGVLRAMTALMLLAPATPMLFQGQEFFSSRPFHYFADHPAELAAQVRKGRGEFLLQFASLTSDDVQTHLPDPGDRRTFERCKLDFAERTRNRAAMALHRDLIALRKADPAFRAQDRDRMHGTVLGEDAFALRFFCDEGDRLLLVNLGRDLHSDPAPEPLLAPPDECVWALRWSSDDRAYGGAGTPDLLVPRHDVDRRTASGQPKLSDHWTLPGQSARVLVPRRR